jgi:hypothetical protein
MGQERLNKDFWKRVRALGKVPMRVSRKQKMAAGEAVWKRVKRSDVITHRHDGRAMVGGWRVDIPKRAELGKVHRHVSSERKVYDVPISKEGFLDFSRYSKKNLNDSHGFVMTGDRDMDKNIASDLYRKIEGKDVPEGYTWHHHHDTKTARAVRVM